MLHYQSSIPLSPTFLTNSIVFSNSSFYWKSSETELHVFQYKSCKKMFNFFFPFLSQLYREVLFFFGLVIVHGILVP